ncbi:hypothetical protein [Marinobacter sp. SS21]|uniref:hypothetical protein n=1 Tax=Marinobacter sp. SS21 TaxID=2979460 RepID=UPI00232E1775|nr:hypothetical protein [Marinobacter sp. SS21]MDC0664379.1 hypothetical protein [Marinobacter sp. SS21]
MPPKSTNAVDVTLNSTFFFLLGFLVANAFNGQELTIPAISSFIIAIIAIYGAKTWKHQIDYKEHKEDKRNLSRQIKNLHNQCIDLHLELKAFSRSIKSFLTHLETSEIEKSKHILESLKKQVTKVVETCNEIDSEIETNSITKNDSELQVYLHILTQSATQITFLARGTVLDYSGFWNLQTEDIFPPNNLENDIESTQVKFTEAFSAIAEKIGLSGSMSLRRIAFDFVDIDSNEE